MTTQVNDTLIWQGESFLLEEPPGLPKRHDRIKEGEPQYADPIEEYLDITRTTACHRGYIATWEVIEGEFYLTALQGKRQLPEGPVLADWVSGQLLAPTKPLGRHVNIRFSPENIEYLRLGVEAGKVVSQEVGKGLYGHAQV